MYIYVYVFVCVCVFMVTGMHLCTFTFLFLSQLSQILTLYTWHVGLKSVDGLLSGTMTISQASLVQAQQIKQLSPSRNNQNRDHKHGKTDDEYDKYVKSESKQDASTLIEVKAELKDSSMDTTAISGNTATTTTTTTKVMDRMNSFPSIVNLSNIGKIRREVIDLQDNKGRTPLYICAAWGFKDLVASFIRCHADITKQDFVGLSPILVAKREIESLMQKVRTSFFLSSM